MDKNCSFVPKNVHFVMKKQKICTFYTKNEVFAKQFDQNVQIMVKKWSFVPKNVHLVPKNGKICTFYTKTEVLPKNFTRLYKFGIKIVVLYPKMHIWSRKKQKKLYFLHYKCSFCQKISLKCTILYKNCSFVPKNVHLVPKKQKICTFYTKNEVFAKKFH